MQTVPEFIQDSLLIIDHGVHVQECACIIKMRKEYTDVFGRSHAMIDHVT